ncbi:MAG: hypothetical protein NVV73_20370 [Cellvibrionaceae bacterium]|nr:hypothetical protein [Cellvibrionaceae bacterium]
MQHLGGTAHIGMEHAGPILGELAQVIAQSQTLPMGDINSEEKRQADADPERWHLENLAGRWQMRLGH